LKVKSKYFVAGFIFCAVIFLTISRLGNVGETTNGVIDSLTKVNDSLTVQILRTDTILMDSKYRLDSLQAYYNETLKKRPYRFKIRERVVYRVDTINIGSIFSFFRSEGINADTTR